MKRFLFPVLVVVCLSLSCSEPEFKIANPTAPTPPMGWNSYDCFGPSVHEVEVKANADYMAKNLKQYGWEYIVIDLLWAYNNDAPRKVGDTMQFKMPDNAPATWIVMDEWGRLTPQLTKFPSAAGGAGFGPLGQYIHSLGLKFGIHLMRGIPRQAVIAKLPVKGMPGITADMVADTNSKCEWSNHMYGLNMAKPGAQQYLNSILDLYASWGVDFLKIDDLAAPYQKAEIEGYRRAIDSTHRRMVLSISPGATPLDEIKHVRQYVQMWRITSDFWDDWKQLRAMMHSAKYWEGRNIPGNWPDCDMLPIGKLAKRVVEGEERYSLFTEDELYTLMTFWCIFRSPLMIGGNLPENRPLEQLLLTNPEVIAVNQQGEKPCLIYNKKGKVIWYSKVPASKDVYVAIFNNNDIATEIEFDLSDVDLGGKIKVRDLWKRKDLGFFEDDYLQEINRHGAALLRLSPQQ